jgi:SAM-dependent methyltransferase
LQDELLLSLLEKAIAADAEIECALTALRCALLRCCLDPQSHDMAWRSLEPFAIVLAHQCFMNEYVFSVSQDEEDLVDMALARIAEAELSPMVRVTLATIGCYRPFHRIRSFEGILAKIEDGNALKLQHLARLQWQEPLLENELKGSVPVLTAIIDATSRAVRSFYEETPYPRWTSVKKIRPMDASTFLQSLFPAKTDLFTSFAEAPRVLVAGCGSGRHAILTAQLYANSDVTAVDLSLASLAYAIRKSRAFSIENLHFAQADLLNLDEGIGSFDIIECSGVLVCIEDPFEGLRSLAERLRPGGVMKIALYSEAARQHVVRARSFIQESGYDATPQGIRECRQAIMASDDSRLREISSGRDFFSMSMVRDLIFHIKEHRFTLGWIETALAALDLAILGFEITDPVGRKRYRHLKPSDRDFCDFEALGRLEAAHPDTFSEMYQFWVYRPGNGVSPEVSGP